MKKVSLKGLDMDYYTETLENGLEVFLVPYDNKKNYFISYATRFGSDVLEFTTKEGETIKPPLGIAHFLEHKMFEEESGEDPFSFFSKSGTDANASTSFDNTQYICYGTKEFSKNLRYLLQFVNNPYYTDENVEKEKGIISEEIKMYQDMPDFQLEMKIRECLYQNHPRRIDIAGSVEEILKITKEDLYSCYHNFYIPNNMFILIVGNFSIEEAMDIIIDEVGYKNKKELPNIKEVKEPKSVLEKEATFTSSNIELPKIAYGWKVPLKDLKMKDLELDLYLQMLTTILFGSSSEFRERVRKEKQMNNIYTEWEKIEDYKTFYLLASTEKPDELIKAIEEEFKNITITEKTFNRIKKVWIANETRMIDNIEATVSNSYEDILKYGKIIPNKIDIIKDMKAKKLDSLRKQLDFKNISIVKMLPNK